MRKLLALPLLGMATLAVTIRVAADASPPLYPPGSAVLPPGQTMIQMVAETVDITVGESSSGSSRAQYEARFSMRNQGLATEQMDVRFPLKDVDSWETIWDLVAFVDGEQARVRKSVEPFALGDPRVTRWAVFPVTFQPGVEVLITVKYSTHISGWGWYAGDETEGDPVQAAFFGPMNPDTATVYYILETGAGWYGPIEKGTIILRFPYTAGPANVFDLDAGWAEGRYAYDMGGGERLTGPSFAGNEARWEFSHLEPSTEDNLSIKFLWPAEWKRIQSLEAEARKNPRDPAVALKLAGAYLAAGASIWAEAANEYHCVLSQQEINRALAYHPLSEELLEGLEIIAGFCPDLAEVLDQAAATLTPSPTRASPTPPPQVPTSTPTETLAATATTTGTRTGTPTATSSPMNQPEQPSPTSLPPATTGASSPGLIALLGLGAGIVAALAVVLIRGRRASR